MARNSSIDAVVQVARHSDLGRFEQLQLAPFILSTLLPLLVSGLLIFGPLAFGAVQPWSILVLEVGVVACLLIWTGGQISTGEVHARWNPLYAPAALFVLLVTAQLVFSRSAYAYVTKIELLKYIAYGIILFVSSECLQEQRTRKLFGIFLASFGVLYSLFAIVQYLTSNGKIYWLHTPVGGGWVFGSYVNHNHYAGFIEMLIPLPLLLALGRFLARTVRMLLGFGVLLMVTSVFLSGSRAGMVIIALELILVFALAVTRDSNPKTSLPWYASFFLALILFIVYFGGVRVLDRFGDLKDVSRITMDRDGLRMFKAHPVLGWGLGTFPTVYPQFRSFYTKLFVNQAHNDYLQLLVECGLIGFALAFWFVYALYKQGYKHLPNWRVDWRSSVSMAALIGCTGLLIHSLVDFNLHIPGNAALFFFLCAAATAPPSDRRNIRRRRVRTHDLPRFSLADRPYGA